jgi:hypothetical protein
LPYQGKEGEKMSKIYYDCQSHHHSVTIDYKELPDGTCLKKGIFHRSKGVAKKSLVVLAGAKKVKWNYEVEGDRLQDPVGIAKAILSGYQAKYRAWVSATLRAWVFDKCYRLICKLARKQTRIQELSRLVSQVQKKQYEFTFSKRIIAKREYRHAKAHVEKVISHGLSILERVEKKLKLRGEDHSPKKEKVLTLHDQLRNRIVLLKSETNQEKMHRVVEAARRIVQTSIETSLSTHVEEITTHLLKAFEDD